MLTAFGLASAQTWQIQALDSFGYNGGAIASGINDSGQVVGYAYDDNGNSHPLIWSNGTTQELASISSNQSGEAYKINSSGQVVGYSKLQDGSWRATIWNGGTPTNIGTVGGPSSFAMNINDSGVVAGSSYWGSQGGSHAFTWTAQGGFVDYGSFNSTDRNYYAGFNGINNSGFLVGTGYRLFSPYHAIWATAGQGSITDLAVSGQFSHSMANAVNDAGVAVGYSNNGSGDEHAAIFTAPGQFTNIDTLGFGGSRAFDINESGWIVGDAFGDVEGNFVHRAFLYRNGEMVDLTTLIPSDGIQGWSELVVANGINEQGQIVGWGTFNGAQTAFVMTPVPEPATMAVLGLGAIALIRRRRRQ